MNPPEPEEPKKPDRLRWPKFTTAQCVFLRKSLNGYKCGPKGPSEIFMPKNSPVKVISTFRRDYPDSYYVSYKNSWYGIVREEDLSEQWVHDD